MLVGFKVFELEGRLILVGFGLRFGDWFWALGVLMFWVRVGVGFPGFRVRVRLGGGWVRFGDYSE